MNPEVFITCVVTGDDSRVTRSPYCAVTPADIAASAIAAAHAGAAIVHIHVRDPDTGGISKEGLIDSPAMIQLGMGIPWGVPANTGHLLAMVNALPPGCLWTSFAISRMQMPWVARSVLLGGNVRVGLEDNLYLSKGVYASNEQLVTRPRTIIEAMGARVLTTAETRERLGFH